MNLTPVCSTNINSIGYEENTLYVLFNAGSLYAYHNVPYEVYNALMNAPSHGKYLANYIKGRYAYTRLR